MKLDCDHHLIEGIERIISPNFDARPNNMRPEVIIIHAISLPPGHFGGQYIEDLFCNQLNSEEHAYFKTLQGLRVSAHLLIRRDGSMIQFVPLDKRAWHAGVSRCLGRERVNDFSIGIELEGCDAERFEEIQYQSLNELIELLIREYPPIDRQRIFGHAEIAPDRKTDPGPYFDWSKVR